MSPKPLVFLTGGTGFIGSQVISACLAASYRLRLSVRKQHQIQHLKSVFSNNVSDLEFVVVPDFTQSTAFHSALDDVDYVFHLASPMPGGGNDLHADYVDPAVKGTLSILDAALEAPSVKRVVVMSSVLGLAPLSLLESDLLVKANTGQKVSLDLDSLDLTNGPESYAPKYQISKILAHQAYHDWKAEKNPNFILTSIHPTFVIGPSLLQTSADGIEGVNAWFWESLHAEQPRYPSVMVDVRDVADAFIKAVETALESGTEFILCGPTFTWKDVVDLVKTEYPEVDVKLTPPGKPSFQLDVSAAEQILGLKTRQMEDTVREVISQQLSFIPKR